MRPVVATNAKQKKVRIRYCLISLEPNGGHLLLWNVYLGAGRIREGTSSFYMNVFDFYLSPRPMLGVGPRPQQQHTLYDQYFISIMYDNWCKLHEKFITEGRCAKCLL